MDKKRFMAELPSGDAIKLANAIYQTYLLEEDSHLKISVARLCEVFGFAHTPQTVAYFKQLICELNEPVVATDYEYKEHFYKWLVLDFCSFNQPWGDEDTYLYLAVNELYLDAMSRLMEEPFIEFKD